MGLGREIPSGPLILKDLEVEYFKINDLGDPLASPGAMSTPSAKTGAKTKGVAGGHALIFIELSATC